MKGGAPRCKGRTARKLAPVFPVVHVFFFLFSIGSCTRGPVSGLLVGDTDGRRSSAGCVVDLRVRTRGAGESSPATWEARKPGATTLTVVGAGRHNSTTKKGGQVTCTVSWAFSVSHGPRP